MQEHGRVDQKLVVHKLVRLRALSLAVEQQDLEANRRSECALTVGPNISVTETALQA